jgi:hypothetical protein
MASQTDYGTAVLAAEFASFYKDALLEIQRLFTAAITTAEKRRYMQLYLQYQEFLKEVETEAAAWIKTNIPRMAEYGSLDAKANLNALGITDFTMTFSQLHKEAVETVIATIKREMSDAVDVTSNTLLKYTRRLQVSSAEQRDILTNVARSVAFGDATPTLSANIAERLAARAIAGKITVGSRTMSLDSYAELVARTHLRVAYSRGTEMRLRANGVHLCVISEHGTQCKICGPLEGKIFSLDGSDPRFPPLSATPNEGTPFHPNCLHVVLPFIEDLALEGEIQDRMVDPAEWPFKTSLNLVPA